MFGWNRLYSSIGAGLEERGVPMTTRIALFLICERWQANMPGDVRRSPMAGWVSTLPGCDDLLSPIATLNGITADFSAGAGWWSAAAEGWPAEVAGAEAAIAREADAIEAELRAAGDLAHILTGEDQPEPHRDGSDSTAAALRWALGNVWSRCFLVGGATMKAHKQFSNPDDHNLI